MKILASVVVRGAAPGDAHGGLYWVEPDAARWELAWEGREGIDWAGRGGDRGLRGLARGQGRIWVAASRELLEMTEDLQPVARHRCDALGLAHQIALHEGWLFVTSTAFDSVLGFEIATRRWRWGLLVRGRDADLDVHTFDPEHTTPPLGNSVHLNQVCIAEGALWLSGRNCRHRIRVLNGEADIVGQVPWGTHDVRPHRGGVLYNDTESDCVCWEPANSPTVQGQGAATAADTRPKPEEQFQNAKAQNRPQSPRSGRSPRKGAPVRIAVPRFAPTELEGYDPASGPLARQAFARGLCVTPEGRVFGGSSPATLTEYDLDAGQPKQKVTLTRDIRHAIHGLLPWTDAPP